MKYVVFFNTRVQHVQVRSIGFATPRLEGFFSPYFPFLKRKTGRVIDWIKSSEWKGNRSVCIHAKLVHVCTRESERNVTGTTVTGKCRKACCFDAIPMEIEYLERNHRALQSLFDVSIRGALWKRGKTGERGRIIRVQQRKKEQPKARCIKLFWSEIRN